jgi:hypothetical protein
MKREEKEDFLKKKSFSQLDLIWSPRERERERERCSSSSECLVFFHVCLLMSHATTNPKNDEKNQGIPWHESYLLPDRSSIHNVTPSSHLTILSIYILYLSSSLKEDTDYYFLWKRAFLFEMSDFSCFIEENPVFFLKGYLHLDLLRHSLNSVDSLSLLSLTYHSHHKSLMARNRKRGSWQGFTMILDLNGNRLVFWRSTVLLSSHKKRDSFWRGMTVILFFDLERYFKSWDTVFQTWC